MKKVVALCLLAICMACENDGPEPEIVSEVLEVQPEAAEKLNDSDQVFMVVEQMPEFAGGVDAWNNYLKNQIEYPQQARNEGVEGRVFVTFIVQPDGQLTDIQLIRGIGAGCDEEARKALEESPYWNPGVQRGKKVATRMQVAITFKI